MTQKLIWKKPYVGPFAKGLAEKLVQDLRDVAKPDENDIYDAKIRRRGKTDKWDVFIQTSNDINRPERDDSVQKPNL